MLYTIIIIFLFFIFLQKANFFKNIYSIITKSHNSRFINSYENKFFSGYCRKASHGYIHDITYKFKDIYFQSNVPKIINYDKLRRLPYWIFLQAKFQPSDKYLIILNSSTEINNLQFYNYTTINNYENRCFFLVKND